MREILLPIKVYHQDEQGQRTLLSETGHGPWADAKVEEARRKVEALHLQSGHLVLTDAANHKWEIPLETTE